jgi:hypothetical protein
LLNLGDLQTLSLDGNGCFMTSDGALVTWLMELAPDWASGCP